MLLRNHVLLARKLLGRRSTGKRMTAYTTGQHARHPPLGACGRAPLSRVVLVPDASTSWDVGPCFAFTGGGLLLVGQSGGATSSLQYLRRMHAAHGLWPKVPVAPESAALSLVRGDSGQATRAHLGATVLSVSALRKGPGRTARATGPPGRWWSPHMGFIELCRAAADGARACSRMFLCTRRMHSASTGC